MHELGSCASVGLKNEVVAPKWRFQNTIFGAVLEFVLKFAIQV